MKPSVAKPAAIKAALTEIKAAFAAYDATDDRAEKIRLQKEVIQPLAQAKWPLFSEVAWAFTDETVTAISHAITPWFPAEPNPKRIRHHAAGYIYLFAIQSINSVDAWRRDRENSVPALRAMAAIFARVAAKKPRNSPPK